MKQKNKIFKVKALILALACIFSAIGMIPLNVYAADSTSTEPIEVKTVCLNSNKFEFDDNSGYNFGSESKVNSYSNGISTMGTLVVEGGNIHLATYNGFPAVAVQGGTYVKLKYKQSIGDASNGGHDWHLSSDTYESVSGHNVGTIGNGAWLIYTSTDGSTWTYTGANSVGINNTEVSYQISGQDIGKGVYVKVQCVAEIYYTYESGSHTEYANWWKKLWGKGYTVTDYSDYFRNIGAEYTFFVAYDTAEIALHSEASQDFTPEAEGLELTDSEIEVLRRSVSLDDGAVSFTTITADFLGHLSDTVIVRYNDKNEVAVYDGQVFSEPGRYEFSVTSAFGTTKEKTVYILDASDDLGYSQYFGTGITDPSVRMYDDRVAVPTYMTGMKMRIKPVSKYLPGLYGTLEYSSDGQTTTVLERFSGRNETFERALSNTGIYVVHLYSSNPEVMSGEIVEYTFIFAISDDKNYAPRLNKELLTSTDRNILYASKVLTVSLKTAGGGSYLYCFPATDDSYRTMAKDLAEQIESLSIESYTSENGAPYWYYKSPDSASVKVRYEGNKGKERMYEVLGQYAEQNVNAIYAEPGSQYAVVPVENVDSLKAITQSSIERDAKVVCDERLKTALQAPEVYLNDFVYKQFADYESSSVVATDIATGKEYNIPYGTDMSSVFDHTVEVSIKESNWNGSTETRAIYYASGDNSGEMLLSVDGADTLVNKKTAGAVYDADQIRVIRAADPFDSQSIMILHNETTGEHRALLLNEANGLYLPTGKWTLSIVNRFNTGFSITVNVKEAVGTLDTVFAKAISTGTQDFTAVKAVSYIEKQCDTDLTGCSSVLSTYSIWFIVSGAVITGFIGIIRSRKRNHD